MSAASAAVVSAGAARGDARRIGILFMVGSACFAVASLPGASEVSDRAVGVVYFVGSIFFTTAAFEQLRVARGVGKEIWAAAIQFAGTLAFNVSTFFGMYHHFTAHRSNLLVRRSATLNLIGSVAFGISAVAGYVVPDTNELVNASLATSTTLAGGLCFLWAARILVKPPPWLLPSARGRATPQSASAVPQSAS